MAFKIDKNEQARIADLSQKLAEGRIALDEAIEQANRQIEDIYSDLNQKFEVYGETLEEARGFVEDIHSERDSEYDEKSENWQEGERGSATREWLDGISTLVEDTLATGFDPLEFEPLDFSEVPDHSEAIENIEQEPNY